MFGFIRDAIQELEHVVWPTPKETRKYMTYNIVVIVTLTLFLMVLGYIIQSGLFAARAQFPHSTQIITTDTDVATQQDLNNLTQSLEKRLGSGATEQSSTGGTQTGGTTSGSLVP